MARILTVAGDFASVLYPVVELARRLADAGHDVTLAAPPRGRVLAAHHGLRFQELEPSAFDAFVDDDARRGLGARLADIAARKRRGVEALGVDAFAATLRELPPQLALIDGEMHAHIITAAGAGIPTVLVNSFASIWRLPDLPPPHRRVTPGVGLWGTRAGMSLLWRELWLRKRLRSIRARARRLGCDRTSLLRELARRQGFDFARETDDTQWLIPFTYRRMPVLSVHAHELEFPHDPPARVRYAGPMILEARVDRILPDADRARLDTILLRRKESAGERRLIYAGFGSAGTTRASTIQKLAAAVTANPSWELVVALGDSFAAEALGPASDRVHAFAWVPQLDVLRHADAAVTHGGINTIDECVTHGVPMLVYSGAETDMAGNTERVAYHGIGIAGDARSDDAARLGHHLQALLTDAGFKERVGRMREAFSAYASEGVAERWVAALLEEAR